MDSIKQWWDSFKDRAYYRKEAKKTIRFVRQFCRDNLDNPDKERVYASLCVERIWKRGPFRIEHTKFSGHETILMHLGDDAVFEFRKIPFVSTSWRVERVLTCEYITTRMLMGDNSLDNA